MNIEKRIYSTNISVNLRTVFEVYTTFTDTFTTIISVVRTFN